MVGRQDLFQQAMNQGHSAAWDQSWDQAAEYYRNALEEFPDHPQALNSLGLALFELQEFEASLRVYQRAARVSPEDPLPMEKVAQLFERLGNLEQATQASLRAAELYLKNRDVNKALENWARVTRLSPENLQAHTRLALVYERIGEKQKAVSEYLAVASLLQSRGDVENAVRSVNQSLQILPNNDSSIQAFTMLRDSRPLPKPSRPRGATAPLRMSQVRKLENLKAVDQPETSGDPIAQARTQALMVLAEVLFEGLDEGQEMSAGPQGVQTLVRGASVLPKQVDRTRIALYVSQVVDLQTNGKEAQAAEELKRAIDAGLEHGAAHYDLAYLYTQTGRLEEALYQVQDAVKNADFALGSHLLKADILLKLKRVKEASIEYLEALRLADAQLVAPEYADDLAQLYDPLIETYRQTADAELQARLCENVGNMLIRPDWRAHLARAREQMPAHENAGPPMPLAEILTEAQSGKLIEALSAIYDYSNKGELQTSMEEAFYALQFAPTYLPLHTFMGELLIKQGLLQDAIAKLTVVARAYSIRGEPHRAIELYRRIIEIAPMDMGSRSRLIEQLASRGKMEEAIKEYFDLAEIYYSMADLDMARKTYTEALRMAQQSRVDRSWRVKILHRLADIDLQSLDWRQAMRIYEQIRTIQPDDERSRSSLIELNFRFGQEAQAVAELDNYITYLIGARQPERAIKFVEGMLSENPGWVPVRRRLGELYRQAGRPKDAIIQFDMVGEALLDAGDRAGAVQVIEAILALNPPNKEDYQQLLAQIHSKP